MKLHKAFFLIFVSILSFNISAAPKIPEGLSIFKKAYPDVIFSESYIPEINDWKISITVDNRTPVDLYWSNGSFLPESELQNKNKYWSLLYGYQKELKDPALMTETEKENLKNFSSRENRKNGSGTPMFLFDVLYDSYSKESLEKHIKRHNFLGHKTNVHERIIPALTKVENRILELSKTDEEVKSFVEKIKSADAYNWRLIDGTNRKSFHSLGIAVDILPVRITGEIYWSWARDKNPKGWMLTPLSKRWLPPEQVVEIFESEGFIWGGKWGIWDNMHFEYHPELIIYNNF